MPDKQSYCEFKESHKNTKLLDSSYLSLCNMLYYSVEENPFIPSKDKKDIISLIKKLEKKTINYSD